MVVALLVGPSAARSFARWAFDPISPARGIPPAGKRDYADLPLLEIVAAISTATMARTITAWTRKDRKRRKLDVQFSLRREGGDLVASGTLTLNRLDYSIVTGEWSNTKWLSGEVKVDFRATLGSKQQKQVMLRDTCSCAK